MSHVSSIIYTHSEMDARRFVLISIYCLQIARLTLKECTVLYRHSKNSLYGGLEYVT